LGVLAAGPVRQVYFLSKASPGPSASRALLRVACWWNRDVPHSGADSLVELHRYGAAGAKDDEVRCGKLDLVALSVAFEQIDEFAV
jgi:hypothetical protein